MRTRLRRFVALTVMTTAVIAVLLSSTVIGQTSSSAQQPTWDPVAIARAHLAAIDAAVPPAARSGASQTESQDLVGVYDSQGAVHVRLQQSVNGIPIEGAVSTLSMRQGEPNVSFAIDKHVLAPVVPSPVPSVSSAAAERAAISAIGVQLPLRGATSSHLAYQRDRQQFQLVWQVSIPALTPLGDWLANVDAQTGAVLTYDNVMQFDSGMVFSPNPYESSGHTVPPPTNCDTAPNPTTLSPLRQSVTLQGIAPAQNKLKGAYVDLTAPGIVGGYKAAGQADEPSRVYTYPCDNDRFEEVMVYYHVDATQRKIQSLGFTGSSAILNSPIPAHAHYSGNTGVADCNAFYSSADKGLHFLDGDAVVCPADFAEDADVIVHEYAHALQAAQVPGWGQSSNAYTVEQTRSIGEGWGDFLGGTTFGDPCVYGWAGNEFNPAGVHCSRDMQNPNVYPADFEACRALTIDGSAEVHCGGLIWGGALWDLAEALGDNQSARDTVLRLVLDSHFYLSPLATFNDGAAKVKRADLALYGGAHAATIDAVFSARGINPNVAYHLRIRHTFIGDLVVDLKIGSITSPLCTEQVSNRKGGSADDLDRWVAPSTCAAFFPPTVEQPWFLEASDHATYDIGSIEAFEVALPNLMLCVATDVPVNIPDATGVPVHATVDCSTQIPPPGPDADGDRCPDDKELGANHLLGGQRDPLDPWDFFDVTSDGRVDLSDTLVVLEGFGLTPGAGGYDAALDRYAPDGGKPWKTAASIDGNGIDLTDALVNLDSFGDDCN